MFLCRSRSTSRYWPLWQERSVWPFTMQNVVSLHLDNAFVENWDDDYSTLKEINCNHINIRSWFGFARDYLGIDAMKTWEWKVEMSIENDKAHSEYELRRCSRARRSAWNDIFGEGNSATTNKKFKLIVHRDYAFRTNLRLFYEYLENYTQYMIINTNKWFNNLIQTNTVRVMLLQ